MSVLLFALLVGITYVAGDENRQMEPCVPGNSFFIDCNVCKCAKDGSGAACTKMMCLPGKYDENGKYLGEIPTRVRRSVPVKREEPFRCEPGKSFARDCNTCICNQDGTGAACTQMGCGVGHLTVIERAKRSARAGYNCVPGVTFKDDCNTCICDYTGQNAMCTLMACIHDYGSLRNEKHSVAKRSAPYSNYENETGETICITGPFKWGCKICDCASDGKHYSCPKECSEENAKKIHYSELFEGSCTTGRFRKGCKYCYCNAEGNKYVCPTECESD